MNDELNRLRQDEAVRAEHGEAVARGEERVLRRARDGRLHSYPADEIGFSPGRGQAQVRTWWGMGVLAAMMALLSLVGLVIMLSPLLDGGSPEWMGVVLLAMGGLGTWYAVGLARDEHHAKQVRRERGSPEPGA